MVTEYLDDDHRQALIRMLVVEAARLPEGPDREAVLRMLVMFSGTDTQVQVERAYPSSILSRGR